jgi:hypothetical protein
MSPSQLYRFVLGKPPVTWAGSPPSSRTGPGAVHDLTAARIWGFIAELTACGLVVLGDKGYLGEEDIRRPYRADTSPPPRWTPTVPMPGSAPGAACQCGPS